MRIGRNPEKDKEIINEAYHRIIIPVYVPNLDGYFEKGLDFTKLCIDSCNKTRHSKSVLSVVNNGCCEEVTQYLQKQYQVGAIDQLIHHKTNVGKIDAIIPLAKSTQEPLVTISDGDVLFKVGWMQAVEEVYQHFPEAGMVSPVPHGTMFTNYTVNTIFDAFFKRQLVFQGLCNPDDMMKFARSIGREDTMYANELRLKYQMTVKRKDFSAVVGCGHFISTLRREVFRRSPDSFSKMAYSSKADKDYIDVPNDRSGYWRLATIGNFAYHMGNQPEQWMYEMGQGIEQENGITSKVPLPKSGSLPFGLKSFVVRRLFMNKWMRPLFYKWLKLPEGHKTY
ncbi:MAG: glycosyltransferase family 2 protein [Flavobacteriaceae bacterium]|nr:glycosyltransferase family 2 protein [Flavobacteriaceae bacterium]